MSSIREIALAKAVGGGGGAVRYDESQNLTDAQKAQGRANIGALAINHGAANVGKALVVGAGGDVTVGDAIQLDDTLTQAGEAADAKATGDAIAAIVPGLTEEAKTALLACFRHVAWADEHGQSLYNTLYNALIDGPVVKSEWIYHFNDSLLSSGTHDFGLTTVSSPTYTTGKFGNAITTSPSTANSVPRAANMSAENIPVLNQDFTVALWFKMASTTIQGSTSVFLRNAIRESTTVDVTLKLPDVWYNNYTNYAMYSTLKRNNVGLALGGICINQTSEQGLTLWCSFFTVGTQFMYLVAPSPDTFSITANEWHHLAMCRKNGVITYYYDGLKVCAFNCSDQLYTPNFVSIGGRQANVGDFQTMTVETGSEPVIDEIYINDEECLYDGEFTPPSAPYGD